VGRSRGTRGEGGGASGLSAVVHHARSPERLEVAVEDEAGQVEAVVRIYHGGGPQVRHLGPWHCVAWGPRDQPGGVRRGGGATDLPLGEGSAGPHSTKTA